MRPANNFPEFGGIRDAAPDAWGRRVIEARLRVPANSLPEAVYLVEAGSDRVGALDVRAALYDVVPRPGFAQERFLHLEVGRQGKLATLDNAMTGYAAFIPERPAAVAVLRRVWAELRQWRTHFEACGVSGRLIDTMAAGIRDLDDIASPALQAELRRSPS